MREFILLSLKGYTSPDFNVDNLVKENRMDLVCRFVSNCLWVSKGYRENTKVHIVLNGPSSPPKIITFVGAKLKGLDRDEKSIAKTIKHALRKGIDLKLNQKKKVTNGIYVSKKSFEKLIREKVKARKNVFYMDTKGKDIRELKLKEGVFVIGDYIGLPKKTIKFLQNNSVAPVSIGPIELFSSHVPIIIHNILDRNTFK